MLTFHMTVNKNFGRKLLIKLERATAVSGLGKLNFLF